MSPKLLQNQLPITQVVSIFEDNNHFFKNVKYAKAENVESNFYYLEETDNEKIVNKEKFHHQTEINGCICTICNISFQNRDDQREHYFLDWHRFNAHRKSSSQPPLTEDDFESYIGECCSISGSDSESDEISAMLTKESVNKEIFDKARNKENIFTKNSLKVFYITEQKTLFSVYKNLLIQNADSDCLDFGSIWVYLMLCAGHFAGAVFNKNEVVVHKTFHRYVIRAKRGTAQAVWDKQCGNAPKSSGSSLRRYNEAALKQEVQSLLLSWYDHINCSNRIFYKCSTYGMSTLFGDKTKILRDDIRLCKISLPTKRPTFNEVKRLHLQYSKIYIHGSLDEIEKLKKAEEEKEKVEEETKPNKVFQKESFNKQLLHQNNSILLVDKDKNTHSPYILDPNGLKGEEEDNFKKSLKKLNIFSPNSLQDSSYSKSCQKTGNEENAYSNIEIFESEDMNASKSYKKEIDADGTILIWNMVYEWCAQNNLNELKNFFGTLNENSSKFSCFGNHLNYLSVSKNSTLLHRAVITGSQEIVALLLDLGADPSVSNLNGQLPYDLASQNIRVVFRRFRYEHPNKYDYIKAKVGHPLTKEEEDKKKIKISEKKKLQNKARKEKLKLKKQQETSIQHADQEKLYFENLSDREKRAVMAERRIAAQRTASLLCTHCRVLINDQNAFEKYGFKYCSMKCVQEHKVVIGK